VCEGETVVADYRAFETAWGWCAAARTGLGLCVFVLPLDTQAEAEDEVVRRVVCDAVSVPGGMKGLVRQVRRYFEGKPVAFEADLDFTVGTPFQRRVWQIVCAIPYGEVRTYQWIGLEMGRPEAMRAIGAAVGANPIPLIVPCHRVVQADGGIGGFSAPGGVAVKRAMLEFEGLTVIGEGQGTTILP
jgi:methylated-DNA-[protein]-cysteine S-methyltransferase